MTNYFIDSRLIIHSCYSKSKLFDACFRIVNRLNDPAFSNSIAKLAVKNMSLSPSLLKNMEWCKQLFEEVFQDVSSLQYPSLLYQSKCIVKQNNYFKSSNSLLINLFYCLLFDLKQLSTSQKAIIQHNLYFIHLICFFVNQPLIDFLAIYSITQQKNLIGETRTFFNPLGTLNSSCIKQFQSVVYQDVFKQFGSIEGTQQLIAHEFFNHPLLFHATTKNRAKAFGKSAPKLFRLFILEHKTPVIKKHFETIVFNIPYSVFCQLLKTSSSFSCEKILQHALCSQTPSNFYYNRLVVALKSLFHLPIQFIAAESALGFSFFDDRFDFLCYIVYQHKLIPLIIELKWAKLKFTHLTQIAQYTSDLNTYLQLCRKQDPNQSINLTVFNQFQQIAQAQALSIDKPIGLLLIPHVQPFNIQEKQLLKSRIQPFKQNVIIAQYQLRLD
uniref:Uncharacterized protein n=1 Tax=Pseudobryopsis hainanensis TaxID=2320808 RepID=A0A386AXV9_9CHLO|nr:hypothetical protein [Pseudobryopsis hainanensis]